ncbi:peptidase S8, partial [Alishewanella sp. SMS9]|nr:peptidase S8 [Alishewanella sp. SMS9]
MLTQKFKLTAIAVLCLPGALFNTAAIANQDNDTSTGPVTRVIIKYKETNTDTMLQSLPATMAQQRKAERMKAKAERFSQRAGEKIKFVRETALEKHAVFSAE